MYFILKKVFWKLFIYFILFEKQKYCYVWEAEFIDNFYVGGLFKMKNLEEKRIIHVQEILKKLDTIIHILLSMWGHITYR